MKPLTWCGDTLRRIRDFPKEARRKVGHQLNRVQHGRDPEDGKPMPTVGPGVRAIRSHEGGQHRVPATATLAAAADVLRASPKKTSKPPTLELTLAGASCHA